MYRLCRDLAGSIGRDNLTYAELIRLNTEHYEKIPWSFVLELAAGLFPSSAVTDSASEKQYLDFSLILNTEEKFEAFLLSAPEPSPEALEKMLKAIDGALPHLRDLLIAQARELPHARGGAPKKLGTAEEQNKIREEIKALRGPGTKLSDIYTRIAQRYGVSASKIKQIWLDRPK